MASVVRWEQNVGVVDTAERYPMRVRLDWTAYLAADGKTLTGQQARVVLITGPDRDEQSLSRLQALRLIGLLHNADAEIETGTGVSADAALTRR